MEVFYLQNYKKMTPAEMDKVLGLTNRMKVVGNNLRKFRQIEGETSSMKDYHRRIIATGLKKISEEGVRVYCERMGEEFGVSPSTIRSDYARMKRYGLII